jgi:hypothetical protein
VNKGTLPIVARLKALQEPAQVAPGGARMIAGLQEASQLTALLRELNETILARSLRFESSGGTSLTLDVAGRRVLRLTEVNGIGGADACLAAHALEDEHKDDLTRILQAVAAPRQELRVTSGPMERETDGMSVGLPVALVADLLLVELNDLPGAGDDDRAAQRAAAAPEGRRVRAAPLQTAPATQPSAPGQSSAISDLRALRQARAAAATPDEAAPPAEAAAEAASPVTGLMGRLARGMGPSLMAWLILGGDEDGATEGPEEMVSHLRGFLEDEGDPVLRQLDLVSNHPGAPICLILGAALVEGHSVLCARAGTAILLGVIEGDATLPLLAAWSAAQH